MAFALLDVVRGLPWLRVAFVGGPGSGKSTLLAELTAHLERKGLARAVDAKRVRRAHGSMWMTSWSLDFHPNLAGMSTGTRAVVIVDTPGGHVKMTLSGAASCDVSVVVVDVERGFDPVTQRDIRALTLLAPRRPLIIALVGKADAAVVDACEADTRAWIGDVAGAAADEAVVTRSLEELLAALDAVPLTHRPVDAELRLDVIRRYIISGRGAVAIGFVDAGVARVGDAAFISSTRGEAARETTITDVHLFREPTKAIGAGGICSVLLRGVRGDQVARGACVVSAKRSPAMHTRLDVDVVSARARALPPGARLQLFARSVDVTVALDDAMQPATATPPQRIALECQYPVPLLVGDRCVLLEGRRAVAAGSVVRLA